MADDEEEVGLDERGLPPIHRIELPEGAKITSTKIRWLSGVGYLPKEIAPYLGVRYQQVRNVLTNLPKRASREDVPPLVVNIIKLSDENIEHMDAHFMEMEMAVQRKEVRDGQRATNRDRRRLRQHGED